jgi:PAS domain S-box-containing protein
MNNEKDAERPLRILHLEDSPQDAEIIREQLIAAGYSMQMDWASNELEFTSFLQHGGYDLVLADYLLPGFDAPAALLLTKSLCPGIPFIAVSGTIGEEKAVELLKQGATDYVLKDRLDKLPLAMERALDELRECKTRKRAEDQLRASEKKLRTLAESSPGVMYTLLLKPDGSSCMTYASPRIEEFCGLGPEEMALDMFKADTRIHPDDVARVRESIAESAQFLSPWHVEFRWRHPAKGDVWVEGRSTPERQPDGSTLWSGFFHDITEHKRMEKELFIAKKLEIIGQLAGGVAHEVRNPLNAILSISEALFKEKEIAGNPEYQPYIEHIRTQVNRLSKLMTDLLDLGKPIKSENIQPVFLNRLCADTIALWNLTEAAREHPVAFACDLVAGDPWVRADKMRLQQAILNLMENAAQCSPKGIGILLRIIETGGRSLSIQVRDTGKGIAQEKINRIFEPFFTLRKGGTGLGLTLVKHFIRSMGGEIRIWNNEPPPGCTAELILDIAGKKDLEHETKDTPD